MKRISLLFLILLIPLTTAIAGGGQETTETTATTTAAAGATWETPLKYASPAEYKVATGITLPDYREAPMLAEKVKAGELPAVGDRLPLEPLVVRPWNQIGTYGGGTLTGGWRDINCTNAEHLLDVVAPDFTKPVTNVLKGYELAADNKSVTLFLREGMKWSDGQPFSADDFMFWYEDVLLNDELTPTPPSVYSPGGRLMEITKIDDYTVKYSFSVPYPVIVDVMASDIWWQFPVPPKHYMQKWHPGYSDDADKVAKEEGFETWYQAYGAHNVTGSGQQDTARPTVYPWTMVDIDTAQNQYFVRNAYYFAVDTDGNQLPYIDEAIGVRVEDNEVKKLKVVSGEFHVGGVWQKIADYPLYKDNADRGDYRAMLWPDPRGALDTGFTLNQAHKDAVKREIFSNIKFRQALSLAINRDEMNDTLFFGMGDPRQASPPAPPASELFEPWMREYYAEYDVDKANALLNEIGLKWDSRKEWRLGSDGKPISILIPIVQRFDKVCQLVKDYWEAVGIQTSIKQVTGAMRNQMLQANEVDIGLWAIENTDFTLRRGAGGVASPPWTGANYPWATWRNTGGASGEEPPQEVKELYATIDEWTKTVPGTDEYLELGKKIWTIYVENLFVIGAVGIVPYPVTISNKLGNTMPDDSLWSPSYQQWVPYEGEQWFFK